MNALYPSVTVVRTLALSLLTLCALVWLVSSRGSPTFAQSAGPRPEDSNARTPEGDPTPEGKHEESEDDSKEEPAQWDVATPPGERSDVSIETDEGTWLSVDVSPDGNEILFDLLGDIYVVNVSGETRALTSGIPWDMQPVYSPNGRWIAFTSDRGAGDNIWVMNRDGSDPRAVTKESFRLLNSPTWTPDSEFIAARKHFTSRRSLGAGEIWLYHRSGGAGVQMVARPNDQKELGEPAFSPDGRYLYYCQDVTPGSTFEYNKDSNGQVFAIQRLDRETGKTERFVGGAGGAIRPTPSPDGTKLAFVRRVRFRSVLHVLDIESGRERALWDGLDRDMQETWAVHGVYPHMNWTPDGRAIVLWAQGKIQRVDVETGTPTVVPFRVQDTRSVGKPLRVPIDPHPATFRTKMLRWTEVSPDGEHALFQALGHVYLRRLPEGPARRLTEQKDHFEYYPSFTRDGKSVVYISWDDDELGAIREVSIAGGESRTITTSPGHYVAPVVSPDGASVVYQRTSGGYLRSSLWSRETGVFVSPRAGGDERKLPISGGSPHFGAASDRVFFTGSDGGKRALRSIGLDGHDARTHLRSDNATQFRVSPDGRWVAFVERYQVFVLPFVDAGRPIDVGPGSAGLPIQRVAKDAGVYVHWAGDSSALHWTLGETLYTRRLGDTFAFIEGAADPIPEPVTEGVAIGFDAVSDRPNGRIAIVGARLVTMREDEIIENGTVLVENGRITAVGPRGEVDVPDDAYRVDGGGLTVLPGLIDVHAHGAQGTSSIIPEQNWISHSELSFGVTTIHDPSNNTEMIFAASEMARAGHVTSPRVFSTGTILYGAAGSFKAEVNSLDDARFHLRRMQAVGAFTVKSYNQPRRDQRQQVVEAARELGMMVVPEGGSLFQHNMTMVVDGHTGVEHCLPVAEVYRDVVQLWSATPVGYTPTLGVAYGGLSGENYWYHKTDVWRNERLASFVPRPILDARSRRRPMAPDEEYNHIQAASVAKKLSDAGVRVTLGAHGQREGLAAHWEIWMFVQGGMTPHEALRAATLNGAWYIGLDAHLGSIEPGKLADLVVLEENPLADIRHSESIRFTMLNGRLYDARTLDEIAPRARKRAPFFFEREASGEVFERAATCGCDRH